jgi:hypothetical protein
MENGFIEKLIGGYKNPKLRQSALLPGQKGVRSQLYVDLWQGNPRLEVATNDPRLKNKESRFGKFTIALDPFNFMAFLQLIRNVVGDPGATKFAVSNLRPGQGDSREFNLDTEHFVGRDADGCVYICGIKRGADESTWPKIKFVFGPSDARYHQYKNSDGSPMPMSEVSNRFALAWCEFMAQTVPLATLLAYVPRDPSENGGYKKGGYGAGSGGGGYKKPYQNNGGGGGYSAPAPKETVAAEDDFGDGIPF